MFTFRLGVEETVGHGSFCNAKYINRIEIYFVDKIVILIDHFVALQQTVIYSRASRSKVLSIVPNTSGMAWITFGLPHHPVPLLQSIPEC